MVVAAALLVCDDIEEQQVSKSFAKTTVGQMAAVVEADYEAAAMS